MPETIFKKEDTGMDYDETFPYEETERVSLCEECKFRFNCITVAPCKDCNGLNDEINKNYFQEMVW